MSGIRIVALEGGLTACASGEPAACARIEPVLLGFSRTSTYFGPFGCGMKVKLVGNLLSLVHNCAAAEAMVLGMKSVLDPKLIHQAISASGSSSGIFEVRGAMMAANDYKKGPECTNQASAARAHWVAEPSLALHWHFER